MSSGKSSPTNSNRISDIEFEKKELPDDDFIKPEECNLKLTIARLTVAASCGVVFGWVIEKSRVFEPLAIRQQMVFESFLMLKIFLAAVCSGQLVLCILSVIPKTKDIFELASESYVKSFAEKGIMSTAIGTFLLGAGMTLSGACPGMVLAQIGAWVPNAIFTLLGLFLGALTYGLLAPIITRVTRPKDPYKHQFAHKTIGVPYIAVALPMCILITIGIILCEYFWPWTKDLRNMDRQNKPDVNIFSATAWPPYASGIFIGLLQLPLVLIVKDTIGGSSSYMTLVSQWLVTKSLQEKFPYLASKRSGVGNWWQVVYVSFAVIGALISAAASKNLAVSDGVSAHVAFLGGLCMCWGARFSSGCTSGHGLSGMALLSWLSFLAVPCMFAGAIVTGFAMQATGALDRYVDTTGYV